MSNNFSATYYINLEEYSSDVAGNILSHPTLVYVPGPETDVNLSLPILSEVTIVPIDTLSPDFVVNSVNYLTGTFITFSNYIGDILTMPNVIYLGDTASLNVSTLVLADKTGRGSASLVSPSGAAFQISGLRLGFENIIGAYTIPQHKSGFTFTNIGGTASFTLTPSGSLGTSVLFVRTGGTLTINPGPSGRIWNSTQGLLRSPGSGIFLATSGAKIGLTCDGSNTWYPTLEEGTISNL